MPELLTNGEINFTTKPHIHPLFVKPKTKLAKLMEFKPTSEQMHSTRALSVHWQAVDKIPPGFMPSAFATKDKKEIEAIENTDAHSIIIGIQGHPEAMRTSHPGLSDATIKHHNLIKNLVKEGDRYHKRQLENKADTVADYSPALLLKKFGITQQPYLVQAEEKEYLNDDSQANVAKTGFAA
jgi:hypothetical protein